jgi:hypothetical protein
MQDAEESREQKVHSLVKEFYEERKSQQNAVVPPALPLRRQPLVAALLMAICAAVWVVPSIVSGGSMADGPAADRNSRLTIYLASLSVRDFQRRNGRTPASLAELKSVDTSTVSYTRLSDSTFELSSQAGESKISYRSTSDISIFLRSDSVLARKQ